MSNILKPTTLLYISRRNVCKIGKNLYNWYDEGIQYTGFKYYPRHPNFKDPPYEPSKLFRVDRIKPVKGCTCWERSILKDFKLEEKDYAIVKNIPEINARLWKIKHLVKIVPVTFPNGFPEDSTGTYLKENGELIVSKKLKPVESRMLASESFEKDVKKIDGDTLRRESHKKWDIGYDLF